MACNFIKGIFLPLLIYAYESTNEMSCKMFTFALRWVEASERSECEWSRIGAFALTLQSSITVAVPKYCSARRLAGYR